MEQIAELLQEQERQSAELLKLGNCVNGAESSLALESIWQRYELKTSDVSGGKLH